MDDKNHVSFPEEDSLTGYGEEEDSIPYGGQQLSYSSAASPQAASSSGLEKRHLEPLAFSSFGENSNGGVDDDDDEPVQCSPFSSQIALKRKDAKTINDPIHGHFKMDARIMEVVDTPEFQRLRDLKQLGSCYFVFPGATHCRFEHSLGVSHLAGKWLKKLGRADKSLEITENDQFLIRLAGLCHDLGHGPFSHVFDNEFIPRTKPGLNWTHEDGSSMMLERLIEENHIDIERNDIEFVKDCITGTGYSASKPREREFLYQIVANHQNSVDVDKFDYILRDCHNVGVPASYDPSRLLSYSRVINSEICFHAKEAYSLYQMFQTRYTLHKTVYSHRAAKAIEYMITDAMVEADPVMDISGAVSDPERYSQLTDCILRDIEFSRDPELEKARSIIHRIRKRDLYVFVDECLIKPETRAYSKKFNEEDVISCRDAGSKLRAEHIILQRLKINYGMKDKNPVESCKFFSKWQGDETFSVAKESVSSFVPKVFEEVYLRVFCRHKEFASEAQRTFSKFIVRNRHLFGDIPQSTPIKSNKRVKREGEA